MAFSEKQTLFLDAILSGEYSTLLYGGSVRSGKSYLVLGFADYMCSLYPGIRVVVIRKTLATLKRNTWPSVKKLLEIGNKKRASLNKQDQTWYYNNGSELIGLGVDVGLDPELNILRGLEATFIILEEANELAEKVFSVSIQRTGQWKNQEYNIPPLLLCTTNPSNSWVKRVFYDPWSEGRLKPPFYYQPALPHDNPWNTKEYLASLELLPESEYERMVKGNWDYSDIPNQLVPYEFFKLCLINEEEESQMKLRTPKYIGIDVAREGDDKTVLCFGDDVGILWFEEYNHPKTSITAPIVKTRMEEYNIQHANVIVDTNGNGAGLEDSLDMLGVTVTGFKSQEGAKSTPELQKYRFRNKRAEAFWLFRMDVLEESILFPYHDKFQKQALAMRYMMPEQWIMIAPKDKLKKDLEGRSPDHFEAAIMMNYARHGFGWGNVSFDYADNKTNQTHLVKQEKITSYDERGKVTKEQITTLFGETFGKAYSSFDQISSMQY